MSETRLGETRLPFDPANLAPDAGVIFIGRVLSPWTQNADCPKNMAAARLRGGGRVEIDPRWRDGLAGLERASHVAILTWLDRASRDLIVQKPRHAQIASGVFSLRSPARPNPIGLHIARLVSLDAASGLLQLDGIDVFDGTPVLDVKPYYASTDSVPDATIADRKP